jgi:hypothetical protein
VERPRQARTKAHDQGAEWRSTRVAGPGSDGSTATRVALSIVVAGSRRDEPGAVSVGDLPGAISIRWTRTGKRYLTLPALRSGDIVRAHSASSRASRSATPAQYRRRTPR